MADQDATDGRSTWAFPVGLFLLVAGLLLVFVVPWHLANVLIGVFLAMAVAGLILMVSGLVQMLRR
jgi:hypothetical protein